MLFIVSCPALTVFHLQGTRLKSDGPNERWWLCFLSEKCHLSHDFGRGLCSQVPRELGQAQGKAGWSGCELQPGGRKTTCSSLQLWPHHSENVPAVPVLHLAHIRTPDSGRSLAGELWLPASCAGELSLEEQRHHPERRRARGKERMGQWSRCGRTVSKTKAKARKQSLALFFSVKEQEQSWITFLFCPAATGGKSGGKHDCAGMILIYWTNNTWKATWTRLHWKISGFLPRVMNAH